MKTIKRLSLGICLGAVLGAMLTAGIVSVLPESVSLNSENAEPLILFLQFSFHNIDLNPTHFLVGCGIVFGVVTGVLSAKVIPNQKRWLPIFTAFSVGVIGGSVAMYFSSEKWVENISTMWEHRCETERVSTVFFSLRSIDRASTNQFFLTNYQRTGREILSNYVEQAENWKPEYFGLSATSSPVYSQVKLYLSTHPDPMGTNSTSP